ncbi:unnamed protein product [Allacma fusca]|uniref:G-protein coupled receptors family 2 profile 2 domain-containing protein n=1 Tax=Allacma fusca TaxID=39272 RepID=A0A8J2L7W0_9HEXA|nr:unnamed protein product [Allacma fusca]
MKKVVLLVISILIPVQIFGQSREDGKAAEYASTPALYKCSSNQTFSENLTFPMRSNSGTTSQTFRIVERQHPSDYSCSYQNVTFRFNSSEDARQFQLSPTGYLRLMESDNIIEVPPESFCISEANSQLLKLHVCPVNCGTRNCLQKCCPSGSALSKKINGSIECIIVPENAPVPGLFPSNSQTFSGEKTAELQLSMQDGPQIRDFPPDNCQVSEVILPETDEMEDGVLQREQEAVANRADECIDNFFDDNSKSGNGTWKLARLACNQDQGLKRRSKIKSNRHNYLYKCSGSGDDHVRESFIEIPKQLRMRFKDPFLEYIKNSNNYTSLFDFNLVERELSCAGETFSVTVSAHNNMTIVDGMKISLNFTPDGFVTYMATFIVEDEEKIEEIYFPRENFCIARVTDDSMTLKFCKSRCFHRSNENGNNICIPKCCYFGAVLQLFDTGVDCDYSNRAAWIPDFYKNELTDEKFSSIYPQFKFHDHVDVDNWNCSRGVNDSIQLFLHKKSDYRILADGRVMTRRPGMKGHLSWEEVYSGTSPNEFCIDAFWDGLEPFDPHNTKVAISRCALNQLTYNKKLALNERIEKALMSSRILLFLVYLPCALIYLLIIIIYSSIWEKQNVQGWTIMAFATSQFFVYVFIWTLVGSVVFGSLQDVLLENESLCVFIGITHYFFLISTFTWTLVLTFDVWAKLSSMTPTSRYYKGQTRFFGYSCFAVGVPIILSIIACAIEYSFEIDEKEIIIPGFRRRCLIEEKTPFLLYVVVVNCLLFAGNLIFGMLTLKNLWDAKKNVKNLKTKSNSTSTAFENKAALVGKLMMLMGFVLIFEVFFKYTGLQSISIWFNVLEIYRLLHAIGLFWIFVCSDKTTKQLREKYPRFPLLPTKSSQDTSNFGRSTMRYTSSTATH